jgi:hypothetical protein
MGSLMNCLWQFTSLCSDEDDSTADYTVVVDGYFVAADIGDAIFDVFVDGIAAARVCLYFRPLQAYVITFSSESFDGFRPSDSIFTSLPKTDPIHHKSCLYTPLSTA